ncbi:ABC-2 transporter permease [Paenibacillus aquistagni]|uniref:ABC-2 family transporter protein n=1 Tax=Paenibacillus aquistagni TaxID=1852522 RepID=A0A1X7K6I7_9BACL|nr:ABC-2 transporter permease [Paenibacillus aquistagni]SMG36500.1 ABC-2 family transporter protein [Paenibacillus aquistagni]
MLFHLIKKDFMIVKKYVLLMLAVAILIPPFMLWRAPEFAGPMSFLLSVIFTVFMLLQYVSMKEYQYPKASTLLCATPYPRSALVKSKYGFCIFIYAFCCVVYWIETLVFPNLGSFSFEMVLVVFLGISIFLGIYLPIQFKLGYEKTKFFFVIIVMASPFLLPQLSKLNIGFDFSVIHSIPDVLLYGIVAIFSLIILAFSIFVSTKIYSQVDLA